MKKWFMNLTTEQQKKAYVFSIVISVLLFYAIALSMIFALPWGAALAAVIIERKIIKQAKKDAAADPCESSEEGAANEVADDVVPSPMFEIKITTEAVNKSEDQEPIGELSCLDFGKPDGEFGRFLNYNMYKIIGTDSKGKRRTRFAGCTNSQQAEKYAAEIGLLPPFKVDQVDHEPPTERQIAFLGKLGVVVPDGITKTDASYMISRALEDGDSLEAPHPDIVALALGLDIHFSAFVGADGLFDHIVCTSNKRNRAALYAYAVWQDLREKPFGNMLEDPRLSKFYAFADQVVADPALMRSLECRTSNDFKKPYRGTAIYKAASSYLNDIKGVKL